MSQSTKAGVARPALGSGNAGDGQADAEVVAFRAAFDERSPLDQLVHEGAQRMLQAAIEAEVDTFVVEHAARRDEQGRRLVVRNGRLPGREILTGAGPLQVQQPRVRDNSADVGSRVQFASSILPPYLRRSKSLDELIPWLYLKGISTGDFSEVSLPDIPSALPANDLRRRPSYPMIGRFARYARPR